MNTGGAHVEVDRLPNAAKGGTSALADALSSDASSLKAKGEALDTQLADPNQHVPSCRRQATQPSAQATQTAANSVGQAGAVASIQTSSKPPGTNNSQATTSGAPQANAIKQPVQAAGVTQSTQVPTPAQAATPANTAACQVPPAPAPNGLFVANDKQRELTMLRALRNQSICEQSMSQSDSGGNTKLPDMVPGDHGSEEEFSIPASVHVAVKTNSYVPLTFTTRNGSTSLINKEQCECEDKESGIKRKLPHSKLFDAAEQHQSSESWNAAWESHFCHVRHLIATEVGRWDVAHRYDHLVREKSTDRPEYDLGSLDKGVLGHTLMEFNDRKASTVAKIAAQAAVRLALTGLHIQQGPSMPRKRRASTKTVVAWRWKDVEQEAFDKMKHTFTSSPVLLMPDPTKPYWVECDTSDFAIGTVLSQCGKDNDWHPVAYLSHALTAPERNYDTHDKELLAFIRALEDWCHYLEGSPLQVKIFTNHKNLEYFTTAQKLNRHQA
ncbi:unnamed protein product [Peniophora sp. CBMAI 1063]|nr:unnamed protein product [Peniophora sp. CBMAI 1063]